jgi:hypothetical protein
MFKLEGPRDERGLSEVLGAIIVLGMVIGIGSVIYVQYVQSSIHSAEASSMGAVGEAFIKLKSAIAAMEIGQSSTANIPMNPSFPLLVPVSGEVGTLSLFPGMAYNKGATSYRIENNKGHVSGSLNVLKADDGSYLEVNQVIFEEKFPSTSGWTMYEVLPDNGGDAFFDSYGYTSGDGTGSISVITSGDTNGYYDKKGHWHKGKPINTPENAYWEHDFGDSLYNYPNVTLQAWFGKEIDYSDFPTTENAAWWIEVENDGFPENQTLYAHQEDNNDISFVAAGDGSGETGNPKPKYPGSLQENDLILMQVTVRDNTTTPTTPTDFTKLYGPDSTGTGRQWIYYKFSNGTETGEITVTIGGGACKIARMYAFRNVARSSFTEGGSFGSGTGATISAQSVTTTGVNRLAVSFVFVNDKNAVGSFTGESGGNWTEATNEFTTDQGSNGCVQLQTATMPSAGTISGGSYTMTAADPWGVRAFELIPSKDYHLLKTISADNTGTNLSVSTASAGRQLWGRFVYPLAGLGTIPASIWTTYYRSWYSGAAPVAHLDISIVIRKSDGTIRRTIADDVADSDNITSTENTYSGTYSFGRYTVENDNDYLDIDYYCHVTSAAPGTAYLRIDNNLLVPANLQTRVENVLFSYPNWNTVLSYAVSTNGYDQNGIPVWNKESTLQTLTNGIENEINKIRVHMYDNLKPKKIDTYLSSWTDEITLFDGPPFDVDAVLTSMPIIAPENLDNIVENLAFFSNYNSAYYTLQIQNSDGNWEDFEPVRQDNVGLDKVYWVETIGGANATTQDSNPSRYIYNNVINIRITGHNDNSPFSLCLDYLDFQVNYKEGSENYLASFYGNSGRLKFTMINYSYPDQTYVYDDGAVIVAQQNSSAMASGGAPTPDFVNVTNMGRNNIRVDVNHFVLTGFGKSSISRRGWSAIRATVVDSYYLNQGANVPNVSIEIYTSPYTDQAWVNYLSGLGNDFEALGYNPIFTKDPLTDTGGEHLTLTIQGKDTGTTPDIYYYEKVTEVQVQLA